MNKKITCSTLVATLAVITVLSLFTPASNRDINRLIVEIRVIDTRASLGPFPQQRFVTRKYNVIATTKIITCRRVAKPIISNRKIVVAANLLKKPAQYSSAVVTKLLLSLA